MPSDKIVIKDLHLRCVIGIQEWERRVFQDVMINVTLFADLKKAGQSDHIDDTVNYKTLAKKMIVHTEKSSYYLVEALGEKLAAICLEDKAVKRAIIEVEKPGALRFSRSVGVVIDRQRDE
ncbi:dihydroneopterin aldolase [Magnetococcales bacterium HHB-1]